MNLQEKTETTLEQDNLDIPSRGMLLEAIINDTWEKENSALRTYSFEQIDKAMRQEDKEKRNLYHWAAEFQRLEHLPQELLTEKNITQPDAQGQTCLHDLAYNGQLHIVPKKILTAENLLKKNHFGSTPFEYAARVTPNQIPPLSYATLKRLKAHFETHTPEKNKDILTLLKEKIKPHTIAQSLKQNHEKIL
jgi:hypothetical protein